MMACFRPSFSGIQRYLGSALFGFSFTLGFSVLKCGHSRSVTVWSIAITTLSFYPRMRVK